MKITTATLDAYDACSIGVEDFRLRYPDGLTVFDWQAEDQIRLMDTLPRWIGWAWKEGLLPMWALHHREFRDRDWVDADFDGLVCRDCKFYNCSFGLAHLGQTYLNDCVFRSCNFNGAGFYGADLEGSCFIDCTWDNAAIEHTCLHNTTGIDMACVKYPTAY